MMDVIVLILKLSGALTVQLYSLLRGFVNKQIHKRTYKSTREPRNVLVIGASFAGYHAARELAHSLPTGWRVIVIEKNHHFQFSWVLPRFSVIGGHEHKAFIPYSPYLSDAPQGSCIFVRDEVSEVTEDAVLLRSGRSFGYDYLVMATGARAGAPSRLNAESKEEGIVVLQELQLRVRQAKNLVVVGGGAAGVELATDAKSQHPEKHVTLVHSRDRLLHGFGPKLHEAAMKAMEKLDVEVILGERLSSELELGKLLLSSGRELQCDQLIKCTGQGYASSLLVSLSPGSIALSGAIQVQATLQIKDTKFPNIFAIGDVVDFGKSLNSRSAVMQAEIAARNVVAAITDRQMAQYSVQWWENAITLTLGIGKSVMYTWDGKREWCMSANKKDIALGSARIWRFFGAKPYVDTTEESSKK